MSLIFILYLADIVETTQVVMFVFWVSFSTIAILICALLVLDGRAEEVVDFFFYIKESFNNASGASMCNTLTTFKTNFVYCGWYVICRDLCREFGGLTSGCKNLEVVGIET